MNVNSIYQSALAKTLEEKFGYKTPKNLLKRFNTKNSDLIDIFKYLEKNYDKKLKSKKKFVSTLEDYLKIINQILRRFK